MFRYRWIFRLSLVGMIGVPGHDEMKADVNSDLD